MARSADKRKNSTWQWWPLPLLCLLLFGLTTSHSAVGDEMEERRVSVGLKIFPAVIAADSSLDNTATGSPIRIAVVYSDNRPYAGTLAARLRKVGAIKGHEVIVEVTPVEQLLRQAAPPDALFLAQRLDKDLDQVIRYSRDNNIISFSPFRGDVESGILAGIAITERILPYINLQTLAGQDIKLKSFFLKVAETYVP